MYLLVIAWTYVVLMMAVAEGTASNGTVLGAVVTFLLYGALPMGILIYIGGTGGRRKKRKAAEAQELEAEKAQAAATDEKKEP